jgi:pimeloyl-ACP methyl ester carboxylesterase
LKERVDKAKNLLILIHGIIGDTEGMMQALRFATQPSPDKTTFDLVITVDYESLNTPIEETAQKLKTALHELGIQANDDKNVTILAHSMGGLISRCLIEQLKGYEFVDKLIMAGTPNGGSAFGKIEQYRSLFSTVLTYSLGFIGWATAAIGTTLTALTGVGQLTKTLGQMNIGSDFIERLNSNFSCPAIPYIIIAGDINHPDFGKAQGGFFAQLSQKVLHSVGNLANQKEPNDIAVSVDSITCLSKYQKCPDGSTSPLLVFPVIPCTHLNYFDDPDSLQILQKIF